MRALYLSAGLKHHEQWYNAARAGLKKHNVQLDYGTQATRVVDVDQYDFLIFLGPNYWKKFERCGKPYLLIGRAFLGEHPTDEKMRTTWSWNGYNGHGTFNVQEEEVDTRRLYDLQQRIFDWQHDPEGPPILMGQHDLGRCQQYVSLQEWYEYAAGNCNVRPRVRRWQDRNTPLDKALRGTSFAITLNSTVACKTLALGYPTVSCHTTNPVYAATSHSIGRPGVSTKRLAMLAYLAHCQYHEDEVRSGEFWEVLGPGPFSPKLCDIDVERINV